MVFSATSQSRESAAARYRAQAVETASPGALLVMLYDRAIGAVSQAQHAMEDQGDGYV